MLARLPTLVGALGAVVRGRKPQSYKSLAIQLGGAFTHARQCSPFWEAFGYPVEHIIDYVIPMADEGLLTFSLPSEYWTNPIRREDVLGMSRGDQQRGALQVKFGDMPDVILRRRRGVCTGFLWDPGQGQHRTKGVIEAVEYASSRLLPGPWYGGSNVRADGTAHGFLVAVIRPKEIKVTDGSWEKIQTLLVVEG